jgi:hypothetical protein
MEKGNMNNDLITIENGNTTKVADWCTSEEDFVEFAQNNNENYDYVPEDKFYNSEFEYAKEQEPTFTFKTVGNAKKETIDNLLKANLNVDLPILNHLVKNYEFSEDFIKHLQVKQFVLYSNYFEDIELTSEIAEIILADQDKFNAFAKEEIFIEDLITYIAENGTDKQALMIINNKYSNEILEDHYLKEDFQSAINKRKVQNTLSGFEDEEEITHKVSRFETIEDVAVLHLIKEGVEEPSKALIDKLLVQ